MLRTIVQVALQAAQLGVRRFDRTRARLLQRSNPRREQRPLVGSEAAPMRADVQASPSPRVAFVVIAREHETSKRQLTAEGEARSRPASQEPAGAAVETAGDASAASAADHRASTMPPAKMPTGPSKSMYPISFQVARSLSLARQRRTNEPPLAGPGKRAIGAPRTIAARSRSVFAPR